MLADKQVADIRRRRRGEVEQRNLDESVGLLDPWSWHGSSPWQLALCHAEDLAGLLLLWVLNKGPTHRNGGGRQRDNELEVFVKDTLPQLRVDARQAAAEDSHLIDELAAIASRVMEEAARHSVPPLAGSGGAKEGGDEKRTSSQMNSRSGWRILRWVGLTARDEYLQAVARARMVPLVTRMYQGLHKHPLPTARIVDHYVRRVHQWALDEGWRGIDFTHSAYVRDVLRLMVSTCHIIEAVFGYFEEDAGTLSDDQAAMACRMVISSLGRMMREEGDNLTAEGRVQLAAKKDTKGQFSWATIATPGGARKFIHPEKNSASKGGLKVSAELARATAKFGGGDRNRKKKLSFGPPQQEAVKGPTAMGMAMDVGLIYGGNKVVETVKAKATEAATGFVERNQPEEVLAARGAGNSAFLVGGILESEAAAEEESEESSELAPEVELDAVEPGGDAHATEDDEIARQNHGADAEGGRGKGEESSATAATGSRAEENGRGDKPTEEDDAGGDDDDDENDEDDAGDDEDDDEVGLYKLKPLDLDP
jgi:hypothetical protein